MAFLIRLAISSLHWLFLPHTLFVRNSILYYLSKAVCVFICMHVTARGIHFKCSLFCISCYYSINLYTAQTPAIPPYPYLIIIIIIITLFISIAVVGVLFHVNTATVRKLRVHVCCLQFNQFNLADFIELSRSTDRQLTSRPRTCRKYVRTHGGGFVSSNVLFRNYRYCLQTTVDRRTVSLFHWSHRVMLSGLI
jgi:hypothetical protein